MHQNTTAGQGTPGNALEDYVRAEQLSLLISNSAELYAAIIWAAVVIAVDRNVFPEGLLALWFFLACALVLTRSLFAHRLRAATVHSPQSLRRWSIYATTAAGAHGVIWGLTASAIVLSPALDIRVFTMIMLGGIMAAGMMASAAAAAPMLCFGLTTIIPAVLAMASRSGDVFLGFAIMQALYALVVINAALKLNHGLTESIRLRFGQAEMLAKLLSSESALATAQKLAHVGSWEVDLETGATVFSTEACRIFGVTPSSLQPSFKSAYARVHPDDRPALDRYLAEFSGTAVSPGIDLRLVMDDGNIKYVRETREKIFDAGGKTVRIIGSVQDITERRLAEEKLLFANLVLKTQMEASPDGIMVADAKRKMIGFNQRFAEIWGIPPADLINPDDDAIRAQMTAKVKAPLAYAARAKFLAENLEEVGNDEIEMADGRLLVRFSRSLRGAGGEYLGRVRFFSDITERRAAERELQLANILLKTQMEASPDAILVVNEAKRIISFNRRFAEIWQIPMAMLVAGDDEPVLAHVTSQMKDPQAFAARVKFLFKNPGETSDDEIETTDGRVFDRHSVSLLTDGGEYLGRAWFFSDNTDRKAAAATLQFANMMLKTQMEASPDGILAVSAKGRVLSYNQRFADMWGISVALLETGDAEAVLNAVVPMVIDPEVFADRMRFLMDHADEPGFDELETTDGRFIERHSRGLRSNATDNLGRVWFLRDVTARRNAEALALRLARFDVLTGLANRAVFVEAVEQAIAFVKRGSAGFAVMYLDLDRFKNVNDTLGHPVGDALLVEVANRLRASTRETDTIARFGGDEFAIVATDVDDPADAASLAEKLVKTIAAPFDIAGNIIHVGASIGIDLHSARAADAETLIAHADVALYRAKTEGRGTYRFFTVTMDREVHDRITLSGELREALGRNELFLVYQPKVANESGRITGVEALLRWQHPTHGLLEPENFVSVAETAGMIGMIGHFVLWTACRQAKAWTDAGLPPIPISVNVSALQFKAALALVSVRKQLESIESLVIRCFWPDSQEQSDVDERKPC
jgi:diguanylate cyclase (GGDEF)-like protein/PAS domain S-box-containing protein